MANLAIVQQAGSDLNLDLPRPLTLDAIGQHLLHRPFVEFDLEDLVRRFPAFFLSIDADDEADSLLIVGQQVRDKAGGRADIVAVDSSGALVLVELKRDAAAQANRSEPFEWQALRYAASYALFTDTDDLVKRLFAPYIARHPAEFANERGPLTAEELARRKLGEFLEDNNAVETFNHRQRIILVAGSFDERVLSACAWLVSSGVDLSCVAVTAVQIGDRYILVTNTLLPTKSPRDYFVPLAAAAGVPVTSFTSAKATQGLSGEKLLRINDLLVASVIKPGDEIYFRKHPSEVAHVVDATFVSFQGRKLRYNDWGRQMSHWSSIDIYHWFILKQAGKTFQELRVELAQQQQQEASPSGESDAAVEPIPAAATTPNGANSGMSDIQDPHQS